MCYHKSDMFSYLVNSFFFFLMLTIRYILVLSVPCHRLKIPVQYYYPVLNIPISRISFKYTLKMEIISLLYFLYNL